MIDTSAATVIGGPKTNNATSAGGNNTQPPQNRLTHLASLPPSNGSKENNTNGSLVQGDVLTPQSEVPSHGIRQEGRVDHAVWLLVGFLVIHAW